MGEIRREWWVVSTAIVDVVLIVECRLTGAMGIVRNPSRSEWSDAFDAPSKPYRWMESARVHVVRERDTEVIAG
jgi:hypothetical protein